MRQLGADSRWISWIFLLLAVSIGLFGSSRFSLEHKDGFLRLSTDFFLLLQDLEARRLLLCILVLCFAALSLSFFIPNDLFLIGLGVLALFPAFTGNFGVGTNTLILVSGMVLAKWSQVLVQAEPREANRRFVKTGLANPTPKMELFLFGLVCVLALLGCWQFDFPQKFRFGPRWAGIWGEPNTYGMLMAVGTTLAIGLLAFKSLASSAKSRYPILLLAMACGLLGVGLICSCSRGAWLGTVAGFIYIAMACRKLNWRHVSIMVAIIVAAICFYWGRTTESTSWYIKRADLTRPSAQHRFAAWRAGAAIMRDHPFGVGWNNAVDLYQTKYFPPDDGAAAMVTNDYMMLGTELGVLALACFVMHMVFCLIPKHEAFNLPGGVQEICRGGVIVLVVAFWFDGGLFRFPVSLLFWTLLGMGTPIKPDVTTTNSAKA